MKISNYLGEFRKWLDGEDAVTVVPETPAQLSEWDEFFVKIAREVETVMKREMFTPPGGPTYLPGEYIIYLSRDDDAQWQGRKREGLEEGLRNGLSQRARQLVGDKVLKTDKIALSLGIDGALAKGHVRVQAVWDDDSPRTEVTPRKAKKPEAAKPDTPPEAANSDESDMTVIRPKTPIIKLNYKPDAGEEKTFASFKKKVEIGRGSKDFPVDLKLEGDKEISRKHAVIEKLDSGDFRVECTGRNSIDVEGKELQPGEFIELKPGQIVRIGIFAIKIEL